MWNALGARSLLSSFPCEIGLEGFLYFWTNRPAAYVRSFVDDNGDATWATPRAILYDKVTQESFISDGELLSAYRTALLVPSSGVRDMDMHCGDVGDPPALSSDDELLRVVPVDSPSRQAIAMSFLKKNGEKNGELVGSESSGIFSVLGTYVHNVARRAIMSVRQIHRVMAAKESIFKYGTFVPRNDREANASPEAARWKAGRDLKWLRLSEQGTFETEWTLARLQSESPSYPKSDIGWLFYVYDFKHSGEHRVRLVFEGSRQSDNTYDQTYAPTVRAESV
jgi:hypothetical protein